MHTERGELLDVYDRLCRSMLTVLGVPPAGRSVHTGSVLQEEFDGVQVTAEGSPVEGAHELVVPLSYFCALKR